MSSGRRKLLLEKTTNKQIANSLMAISIVTKKLARQVMSNSKGENDVEDEIIPTSERRRTTISRKSGRTIKFYE